MISVTCTFCEKVFYTHAAWIRKGGGKHCSRSCFASERTGKKNSNWRGGNGKIDTGGYKEIYLPSHPRSIKGLVREHIVIAEGKIGKQIPRGYHVHHKDGDPSNNNPDNLEVFDGQRGHKLRHAYNRIRAVGGCPVVQKICSYCHALKFKTEFNKSKNTWDGFASMCRICAKNYMITYLAGSK